MSKNGDLKFIISSETKKKMDDETIDNKNEVTNKLFDKYSKKKENLKDSIIKLNNDNFRLSNFNNFKTKKKTDQSNSNSNIKYTKNNTSLGEMSGKEEENINDEKSAQHQHFKNLSNTNKKKYFDSNNKYIYETKMKKTASNYNTSNSDIANVDTNEKTEKQNKISNNNNNVIINKNDNNTFYKNNINYGKNINKYKKKINTNYDNKIEKILSKKIKNNIISKDDILSFIDNKNNNKKIINNINNNNYMSTNSNNENNFIKKNSNITNFNTDMKCNISLNKKYEKSCPKLNFNKNIGFYQPKNNTNIKQLNYGQINEDNNTEVDEDKSFKKPSIEILKSIRGNLMTYYNQSIQNENNALSNKDNIENNKNIYQKKNNKNIIEFFLPNKEKNNLNNNNNNKKIGNLQNIIMKNDDNDINRKVRINTQVNNSSKNNLIVKNNNINNINGGAKIINKSMGLRKIRTINDKNEKNDKKDLTVNNLALKKRRPRYFDSENKSNIIDSTNILGNNIKNKNNYLNVIRKAFNNKNKNYYINFMTNKNNNNNDFTSQINNNKLGKNNTFVQKSERDSKSFNVVRNRSNTYLNKDNNIKKKLINTNDPYMNNLVKMVNNKDSNRHYSVNQKNNITNTNFNENNPIDNKQNKTNNIINNNYNVNNEIDEKKIKENISNNSLNTYSIFISNKYYKNQSKIGLKKIRIFDINDNEIPIMFYQTNSDFDNGRLFNTMMTNINLLSKSNNMRDDIINNNIPFITEIKKDIYIYFHINNNISNNIKYIQIINYNNKNNTKISSVKNIEIYKSQNLIYKGVLNNDINIIPFSNFNNGYHYNNLNYSNNIYQERPFSTSKIRTQNNTNNNKMIQYDLNNNGKNNKNQIDVYHTARNNLFTRFTENIENANYNEEEYNNIKLFNKTDGMNINESSIKKNNNESNTINIHINNNTNNITNLEFFEKNEKIEKENGSYAFIIQNSSENKQYNEKENNIDNNENINGNNNNFVNNDNILMTSVNKKSDMTFDKTNSENAYNETDIYEGGPLTNSIMDNQKISDINSFENNQNLTYKNTSLYNTVFNRNNNYISFNKIKFIITSNYGHKKYVGLTGIKFYNIRGDLINVETADSIGALPKDLRTIFDDEYDNRIFENVFNEEYNTDDVDNMWVTKLKRSEPKSFIELVFKERMKISKIKFYNYNEKNNLHIGAKTIELYLDDNYYGTIYLRPGIGERACACIKTNKKDNDINNENNDNDNDDESDYYKGEDFGQIISFPIKNVEENKKEKFDIKYASFLYDEQCYETPFMPCGYYIKFEFLSNYYKGKPQKDEAHIFKYTDIGLDSIEIYDNDNINIISDKSMIKYKIITNCEKVFNTKNKLILNGMQNENGNNCIFYMFEEPIRISYIKFNPLTKKEKSSLNSVKEIKIYCESKIIFEGDLYLEHPTIALFTCDLKFTKSIDKKYLTQKINVRESYEIKKDNYISLILN